MGSHPFLDATIFSCQEADGQDGQEQNLDSDGCLVVDGFFASQKVG